MSEAKKVGFGNKTLVKHENEYLGGAILEIEAGKKTDMAFHRLTDKLVYVLMGKLAVTVLKDGKMSTIAVDAGNSFFVRAGLVHQLEGLTKAIVVEFVSVFPDYESDVYVISRGTQPAPEAPKVEEKKEEPVPVAAAQPEPVKEEEVVQQKPAAKPGKKRNKKAN